MINIPNLGFVFFNNRVCKSSDFKYFKILKACVLLKKVYFIHYYFSSYIFIKYN